MNGLYSLFSQFALQSKHFFPDISNLISRRHRWLLHTIPASHRSCARVSVMKPSCSLMEASDTSPLSLSSYLPELVPVLPDEMGNQLAMITSSSSGSISSMMGTSDSSWIGLFHISFVLDSLKSGFRRKTLSDKADS